jgi:thioredoxin reductase (NADPH)
VVEADAPGGQAWTSSRIENYLGLPLGISGGDLAHQAEVQAQKFGAHIVLPRRVVRLSTDSRPYPLELDDGSVVRGHTVVLATGARYRSLPLADIDRFVGAGVHPAATPSKRRSAKATKQSSWAVEILPAKLPSSCQVTPPTCT